jgi:hypothetical protein
VTDSEFCAAHRDLAADLGEDAVRAGRYPRRRQRSTLTRVVREDEGSWEIDDTQQFASSGNGGVSPSDVRARLGEVAAEHLDALEAVLLQTAVGATMRRWVSIECKGCGLDARYEVEVPDHRARLDAVEKLLQQGLGRAREAAEPPSSPRLPQTPAEAEQLSWDDLRRLADLHHLEDRDDLRGRLEALSPEQRDILRATLLELS